MNGISLTRIALLTAIALGLGGCAIVRSDLATTGASTGLFYMLPKALLPVRVVESANGALRLDILEPVLVGDPAHAYTLNTPVNLLSSDKLRLEVDPRTALLTSVNLESRDETGEVLKKIITTAKGFQAEQAVANDELVIYQYMHDPSTGTNNPLDALARAVAAHALAKRANCLAPAPCAQYQALDRHDKANEIARVDITPLPSGLPPPVPANCSVGICHRGMVPYDVKATLFGETRHTVTVLPNHAPVLALPLERAPLVTVKHTVALNNGMVQTYQVERPSSALAIVSWPLDVYKAVIDTTKEIVQLKLDTSKGSGGASKTGSDAKGGGDPKASGDMASSPKPALDPKPDTILLQLRLGRAMNVLPEKSAPGLTPPPQPAPKPTPSSPASSPTLSPGFDGKK